MRARESSRYCFVTVFFVVLLTSLIIIERTRSNSSANKCRFDEHFITILLHTRLVFIIIIIIIIIIVIVSSDERNDFKLSKRFYLSN